MESVVINEPTEEENISLEKQAEMQAEAKEQKASQQQPKEVAQEEERPEWLDDKFKSPEDLAKAYNELQSKLGDTANEKETNTDTASDTDDDSSVQEEGAPMAGVVETATAEFSEKGELSDKTFDSLEQAGLPREMVEAYIQGQEAIAVGQAADVQQTIGGLGNYEAMAEWAGENLDDADLDAFNAIVETGTVEQAKVAVKGLYSQFLSAGGKPPQLIQGDTVGSGLKPYTSSAQITEAMRDPRYKNDPAFRESVEKRLAVSDIF
jgi:hypothetical protein